MGHTYVLVRISCGGWRWLWLTQGQTPAVVFLVNINLHETSQRPTLPPQDPVPLKSCRLQYWDASGQTTNWVGTQCPSADRLLKIFLSMTWLSSGGEQNKTASTVSGQEPASRKPVQASYTISSTRGQRVDARKTAIL